MAEFQIKTKNQIDVGKKPRVYFTCHPEDFDRYFSKIREDIFKTHDCAIYYTTDMSAPIEEESKETDLGRHSLFVVPVTQALLTTPSRAMDEDIPYALQKNIPVLPVIMEGELDTLYSQPDKFGSLQYLNAYHDDPTEIPYEQKLKNFLDSVLISDELAQRIRSAFDAYIFLSYRKKDRRYANELMRLIHQNPECRDIAIWFDEFLTPGESFKENIEKVLDDCHLFTLLVTPHLLEEGNYILTTELPMAREKKEQKGTDIFAVEMEDTDRQALAAIDISDYVNGHDEAFRPRLLETVSKLAIQENNTPEHNFLIGLAYLEGIDVEVNRQRGMELIAGAADAGLVEAMEKLLHLTLSGLRYVPREEAEQALVWAQRLVDHYTNEYGEEHKTTLVALRDLARTHSLLWDDEKALATWEKVYALSCKILGEQALLTISALQSMARLHGELGHQEAALQLKKETYEQFCKTLGEHAYRTDIARGNLAYAYEQHGLPQKALQIQKEAYRAKCLHFGVGKSKSIQALSDLAKAYSNAGDLPKQQMLAEIVFLQTHRSLQKGRHTAESLNTLSSALSVCVPYNKRVQLQELLYQRKCELLGEDDPRTFSTLKTLAFGYSQIKDYPKELALYEKLYRLKCKVWGEEDTRTIEALGDLAFCYRHLGDRQKETELREKQYALYSKILGEESQDAQWALHMLQDARSETHQPENEPAAASEQNTADTPITAETAYALACEIFDEDPVAILPFLKSLAVTCHDLGNLQTARGLCERVYDLQRNQLGEEHPDTIKTLFNLAIVYGKMDDHQKKLELCQTVYALYKKSQGEDHPYTIKALNSIAAAYDKLGDHQKELEARAAVYQLRRNALGEEHPDTIKALSNLALTYDDLEDYAKELELLEQVYALQCKLLGAEHPDTQETLEDMNATRSLAINTLFNQAFDCSQNGDHQAALELKEKAYALACTAYGKEHPSTLDLLESLAHTYSGLGDPQKERDLREQVYALRCAVLGEEHPDTLYSARMLAYTYSSVKDFQQASMLWEKIYALTRKLYGADHPDTQKALENFQQAKELQEKQQS